MQAARFETKQNRKYRTGNNDELKNINSTCDFGEALVVEIEGLRAFAAEFPPNKIDTQLSQWISIRCWRDEV